MPEFGLPFTGLANKRKLTKAEVVRAIRFAVAEEYEVAQVYMQLAQSINNKLAEKVLKIVEIKNASLEESSQYTHPRKKAREGL